MRIKLFHPECAGTKITVTRGWFGSMFYSKDFASLGEVLREYKRRGIGQ
jgi:hypothetical protein